MSKKKNNLGDDLLIQEELIDRYIDRDGLQCGDILALIYQHIKGHRRDCIEEYTKDNSAPEFFYGHRDELK